MYRSSAPNARVLLIKFSFGILTSTFVRRQRVVKFSPAAAAVLDMLAECEHYCPLHSIASEKGRLNDEKTSARIHRSTLSSSQVQPKILLHIFSNGGMNSATHLVHVLRSRMDEPLTLRGMLFDSYPGKGTSYCESSFPNHQSPFHHVCRVGDLFCLLRHVF